MFPYFRGYSFISFFFRVSVLPWLIFPNQLPLQNDYRPGKTLHRLLGEKQHQAEKDLVQTCNWITNWAGFCPADTG